MRTFILFLFLTAITMTTFGQKEVTVAMCQVFLLDGDVAGNFARIENAIVEAKKEHAEIVAFPESSLLGWLNSQAHQRANTIPGHDSDKLCALAKKYKVHICIGLDEKEGSNLYGSALLIDDEGKILLKHRKINVLPDLMTPPYSVGSAVETAETKFGRIGVLICADSFMEDVLAKMKTKKPALLIIPYGWAADESEWPQHGKELEKVVSNAAIKVECPVIGTDLVGEISDGPWKGKTYGGQSYAADKSGKIIGAGKDRDRDIVIVRVKL